MRRRRADEGAASRVSAPGRLHEVVSLTREADELRGIRLTHRRKGKITADRSIVHLPL